MSVETVDEALRAIRYPTSRRSRSSSMRSASNPPRSSSPRRRQEGRHPRPRPPGQRPPDRQAPQGLDLRHRRPPPLQPRRQGLRQGRNLLRRAVRRRPRRGRRATAARPGRRHARAVRPTLHPELRRRHLHDPGRQDGDPGPRTQPRPTCRPPAKKRWPRCKRSTTSASGPRPRELVAGVRIEQMRLVTGFFVVALVLPLALPAAGTDSLAEIAKKERERRKSKPSQPAKTYDDADLAKGSTSPADDASDEATPPGGESTTPADAPAPDGRLPDDEEGRKQLERLWRARFAEAQRMCKPPTRGPGARRSMWSTRPGSRTRWK